MGISIIRVAEVAADSPGKRPGSVAARLVVLASRARAPGAEGLDDGCSTIHSPFSASQRIEGVCSEGAPSRIFISSTGIDGLLDCIAEPAGEGRLIVGTEDGLRMDGPLLGAEAGLLDTSESVKVIDDGAGSGLGGAVVAPSSTLPRRKMYTRSICGGTPPALARRRT